MSGGVGIDKSQSVPGNGGNGYSGAGPVVVVARTVGERQLDRETGTLDRDQGGDKEGEWTRRQQERHAAWLVSGATGLVRM